MLTNEEDPLLAVPGPAAVHTPLNLQPLNLDDERPLPPDADFGDASLDEPPSGDEIRSILARVDDFLGRGYHIAGLMLLEHQLQATRAKNPWFLLGVLDLYGEMGQQQSANHGLVARQLQALYNVDIASRHDWRINEGPDLQSYPEMLALVSGVWSRPQAPSELAAALIRPSEMPALSLAAFRDALLLHAIAVERHRPDDHATEFQPFIDWTPPAE